MVKGRFDIHDYAGRLRREREMLQESELSDEDKGLIRGYGQALFLAGVSPPRIEKETATLRLFAERMRVPLKSASVEDLKRAIGDIRADPKYSVWTKADYGAIVKKFYHWLEHGDKWRAQETKRQFPMRVAWIVGTVKKREQPRLQRADMLTEDEARKLIDAADSPRDKALLAVLWDTGARIGEIGNLRVGNVTFSTEGTYIDMTGKTGQRTPFVVECTRFLLSWLSIHPQRDDPQSPLWVSSNNGKWILGSPMTYNALVKVVERSFVRANNKKGFNPHLFRHSRATWCATNGWTHLEMCKFFGWAPDSNMPAYYTSLVNEDVHARMRKCYGLDNKQDDAVQRRTPVRCHRCDSTNGPEQRFCYRCGMALTQKAHFEAEASRETIDKRLNELIDNPEVKRQLIELLLKNAAQPAPTHRP